MENTFGENLKRIREERGLSQEQFAQIFDTSKQVISRYETGQRSPKINVVSKYAHRLNVDITELTGYIEKPAISEDDGLNNAKKEIISKLYQLSLAELRLVEKITDSIVSERD